MASHLRWKITFSGVCAPPLPVEEVPVVSEASPVIVGWRFWLKDRKDPKSQMRVVYVYNSLEHVPHGWNNNPKVFVRYPNEDDNVAHGHALVYLKQFFRPGDELCGVPMYDK